MRSRIRWIKGSDALDLDIKSSDTMRDIPHKEQWLFDNPIALESVMRGLEDAIQGRISKIDAEILEDGIEYERDNPDYYLDDDLIPDF